MASETDVGRVGKPTGCSQAEPEEVSALRASPPRAEFTPGPWAAHIPQGPDDLPFVLTGDGGDPLQPETLSRPESVESNARLIAAAPDYDAAADQAIAAIEALTGTIPEDQMEALMAAYRSLRSARFKAGCDVRPSERATLANARGDQ